MRKATSASVAGPSRGTTTDNGKFTDSMLARDIEANIQKLGNSLAFDRLGQSVATQNMSDSSSFMVFSVVDKSSKNAQKEKNRLTKAKKD